jgi:hypothetical protein
MPTTYVPPENQLVRYVPWARLRRDENDNVVGVLGAAFRLRQDEDYLSATWLEFFPGSRDDSIKGAVGAIRNSDMKVTPKSGFAIGNVGRVGDACRANHPSYKIRFVHEPEDDNKAHVACRGWPRDDDALLNLLAEDAWSETVLNKDIP